MILIPSSKERGRKLSVLFPLAAAVLLWSCSPSRRAPSAQVLRYNEVGNILSMDPAFARVQSHVWAVRQVFSTLVRLDDDLRPIPDAARRWEISPGGLTYKFILRDDVFFHKNEAFARGGADSTRRVTASDFVYSFSRLTDPSVASPGGWTMSQVRSVEAADDTTLFIRLREPSPGFLSLLSCGYCSVVPREAVEYYGSDFRARAVGSGPFYIKYWKEGEKLVLRKNEDYFERDSSGRPLPYLEAINITFLPDKQAAFLQFLLGKIDFISGIDPSYADQMLTPSGALNPQYKDRVVLQSAPYLNTEYLGIRQGLGPENPLSDLRIRRALYHGFDREKMMLYLRKGIGEPSVSGIVPSSLAGHWSGKTSDALYDPALARRLVEEYRREKGEIPPFTLQTVSGYQDLCEYIQSQWQSVGLPLRVEIVPPSTLRQSMASGKSDFFRASWVADYPDAESFLSLFYSPNKSPAGPNYTGYSDPLYDSLYEASTRQTDPIARWELYRRMDSLSMQKVPVIPLYYDRAVRFVNPSVRNFPLNGLNLPDFSRVYKSVE